VQFRVKLLVQLLLVLDAILLALHAPVVQVVRIHSFALRFKSFWRVLLCLIFFLCESAENIFRFLRRTASTINFRYGLVSLLLLLYFYLLQRTYLLLSHLLVVELIVDKLLGGAILMPLWIGDKCTLLLLSKLDFLLDFINLLILTIEKGLLPSNELIFLLVFLIDFLGVLFFNH